jgi:hypothetical protein
MLVCDELILGIAKCLYGNWGNVEQVYLSTIKIEISGPSTPVQYTPLNEDVLCGKTFNVGIVTESRIQPEGEKLEFEMPIREHVGHLKAVLTAGESIPVDQDTLEQIRYFHSSAFGAFLRIRLEIDSDFGYMIAPVLVEGGNARFDYDALKKTRGMIVGQTETFDELGFKDALASYIRYGFMGLMTARMSWLLLRLLMRGIERMRMLRWLRLERKK